MSICTPCTKTLPIVYCSDSIYIGDWIAGAGITVQVYYKNTANGSIQHEKVTTGVNGKIAITFANRVEGSSYEVWVNSSTAQMSALEAFYFPNTTYSTNCITLTFNRVKDLSISESIIEQA